MLEALLGAGASLLSSLFGGGDEPQTVTNRVDYQRMVRDAEAAGFNPLTALRNGGAAGFSISSTAGGGASTLSRVANGLAGATQSFLQNFDPMRDQKNELEARLAEAQIANLNASTAAFQNTRQFGGVPTYTATPVKRPPMGANIPHSAPARPVADAISDVAKVAASGALRSKEPTTERPTRTNPYPSWMNMEVNPWMPDGQAWNDHFGENEIMSTLGSAVVIGHDAAWNGYRAARGVKRIARNSGGDPYRAPPDPYDMRMYIPPAFYGGPSYR